ncbi:MAG TPA: hypothetical protein VJJ52_05970 [Candidatus Nanoarchaeia archaeon]|nr:hypothetical protein [Candidatus Nanoarchaeia archaeon]
MRKSQLYGQIFIYILTILLIFFILIYGYNAISNFKGRTEQIVSLKLGEEIKNSVQSITPDFGSVVKKELDIGGASEICFVESYNIPSLPIDTRNKYPLIQDSVDSKSGKNVFLVGKNAETSFYGGIISVEPDLLCIAPKGGRVNLKLEGMGDHADITKWT